MIRKCPKCGGELHFDGEHTETGIREEDFFCLECENVITEVYSYSHTYNPETDKILHRAEED